MAKDISPEKLELRKRARQLARNAGENWRDLAPEDRRAFVRQARKGGSQNSNTKIQPARQSAQEATKAARAAAIKDGRKWREMSKEERQKYFARTGGA